MAITIVVLLLSFSIFLFNVKCYAEETQADYKYVSEEVAVGITNKITKNIYGESARINQIQKIYNLDDTFYGYKIEFCYENYYDYIVIVDTNDLKLIVNEFSVFTENQTQKKSLSFNFKQEKLYIVAPFTYAIKTNSSNIVLIEGMEVMIDSNVEKNFSPQTTQFRMPPIDDSTILDNYKGQIKSQYDIANLSGIRCITQESMNPNSNGNCGPTAALNILNYWQHSGRNIFEGKSINTVYREVVGYMGKEDGTTIWQMENGVKSFVKNTKSFKASTFVYWGAFWGYYKSDLNKDKPIIHCITGKDNKVVAHAMAAYGYLETTEGKYLKIASGWKTTLQYINFDAFDLKLGSYCTIKEK